MSYTNKTPNYELPQYVADDKPTYLGDFNKAMLDIDTNMKSIDNKTVSNEAEIQTAITTANTAQETANEAQLSATQANTLAQTAKTTADTATSNAATAQTTAEAAQTTATNAQNSVNDLAAQFNLSSHTIIDKSQISTPTGITVSGANFHCAKSVDDKVFKLYGRIILNSTLARGWNTISIPIPFSAPTSNYNIECMGVAFGDTQNFFTHITGLVTTNGKLTLSCDVDGSNKNTFLYIFPCLYFNGDFGDTDEH